MIKKHNHKINKKYLVYISNCYVMTNCDNIVEVILPEISLAEGSNINSLKALNPNRDFVHRSEFSFAAGQ